MAENTAEGIAKPASLKKYAMIAVPLLLAGGAYAVAQAGNRLDCASSGAQTLVINIAKQKSFMLPQLEGQYRASGKDNRFQRTANVQGDPEYQSLMTQRKQLTDRRQQAMNFCQDDAQHPAQFAVGGPERNSICGSEAVNGPDLNSLLETCDEYCADRDYVAESVNTHNAAYRHYFAYAKANIYPLNAQIAQIDARIKAVEERSGRQGQATDQANKSVWREVSQRVQWSLDNIITSYKQQTTGSVACKAVISASLDGLNARRNIEYTIEKNSKGELYATVWGL